MEEITTAFLFSAFVAGVFTFLAPCTFPLVPVYLGFISGGVEEEGRKWKIFRNGVMFILGFSVVFILLGTLIGLLGEVFGPEFSTRLSQIGGVVTIIFGLYMIGLFKLPFLEGTKKLNLGGNLKPGTIWGSFLVGLSIAFGWSPCTGPILTAVLSISLATGGFLKGIALLSVFSLGLAVPFALLALFAGYATAVVRGVNKYLRIIEIIGGVFLLIVGYLLLSNNFIWLINTGFEVLDFINYERIYEFL